MNEAQLKRKVEEKGFELTSTALSQFETYYELLVEWNGKMNLSAITEKEEVYNKHFFDSVSPAFFNFIPQSGTLCDVGSGAGFPSLPLKILFPNLHVTIVDSLQKRITFLEEVVQQLGLKGVSLYHDRAEQFGRQKGHREAYDVVTARAVARMSVLSELCLPLVKKEGLFLALKGPKADEEFVIGKKAVHLLGGQLERTEQIILPEEGGERNLLAIRKVRNTPKAYPRKAGTPNKKPLGEESVTS
ncbi:16S rRNA (guanine(527)-N(7))-methyltransferase RsmG [Bacillus fonticola]|uniref:16S rRNA (guanine(527)-N(7))-methyltransferase RsmG n=1 Tax=Bacillus fonticola TaxID=2728853 RepID=UPI0014756806|nr:16S rRNA (guanine(527)-N(7))-methyltransferase RsmG [Bacillus fonticola]